MKKGKNINFFKIPVNDHVAIIEQIGNWWAGRFKKEINLWEILYGVWYYNKQ